MYRSTQDFWDTISTIGMQEFCKRITPAEADERRAQAYRDLESFHIANPDYNPWPKKELKRTPKERAEFNREFKKVMAQADREGTIWTPAGPYYLPGHPKHWSKRSDAPEPNPRICPHYFRPAFVRCRELLRRAGLDVPPEDELRKERCNLCQTSHSEKQPDRLSAVSVRLGNRASYSLPAKRKKHGSGAEKSKSETQMTMYAVK